MRTKIFNVVKVSTLALILSFGLSYVYAWTAPTANPPAGNVSAPINTSATAQTKAGDFTLGGLLSGVNATFSRIGIGAAADPAVALNVAGIIKTTGFQLTTGAGAGKVLTSDSLGNTTWADASQAGGGGALPEEILITTSQDFLVPSWMTSLVVEVVAGGGGGGSAIAQWGLGGAGGTSSFGPVGAPIIRAAGGGGGGGGTRGALGANGTGTGGSINTAPYAFFGSSYGAGGAGGVYPPGGYGHGGDGGMAGYSKGLISVTPGQTMKVIVGAGGGGACYSGSYCGTAGKAGYVHLTYMPAPALANSQTFAANGTFTVPAGVTNITVEAWGAGGAGGPGGMGTNYTGYHTYTAGGGGSSGGYAKSIFTVTPGATYPVVIGTGGTGTQNGWWLSFLYNTQGKSGTASSFGSGGISVSANGGSGGINFDTFCGGGSCNGDISCTGGWQAPAGAATGNFLSITGNAGGSCNVSTTGGAGVTRSGRSFGAGGNGGPNGATSTNYPGATGAVVVSW